MYEPKFSCVKKILTYLLMYHKILICIFIFFFFRAITKTRLSFISTIETNARIFGKNVSNTILSLDVVRLQQENGRNIGYLVGVRPLGKIMKKLREINIWGFRSSKSAIFCSFRAFDNLN